MSSGIQFLALKGTIISGLIDEEKRAHGNRAHRTPKAAEYRLKQNKKNNMSDGIGRKKKEEL